MDINKKFKYLGFGDLCTSSVQIEVASLTTILSMYDHLYKDKDEIGFFSTFLWPIVNVVVTVVVILINLGQIQSARQLIRAANEEIGTEEMESLRVDWISRNKLTFFAVFVWFPGFGMTLFWHHGWPLSIIMVLFLVTAGSRGMVTWGIHGIEFGEQIDIPEFPPDLMGEVIEMVFKVEYNCDDKHECVTMVENPSKGIREGENMEG